MSDNIASLEFDEYRKKQILGIYDNCFKCDKENRLIKGICKDCYINLRMNMRTTGLTEEEEEIINEVMQ